MDNPEPLPKSEKATLVEDVITEPRKADHRPALRTELRLPRLERRKQPELPAPDSSVVWEQVAPRPPYEVTYACLLIPRFGSHRLIGDISESLREWMQRICISFSWRLESMLVRPEYMQWVLCVPATTPLARCIRTIREQTSQKILEDFPDIRRENLSKDFWAPGYIVLVGATPHPREMIEEFIRATRQQQGIQPHWNE